MTEEEPIDILMGVPECMDVRVENEDQTELVHEALSKINPESCDDNVHKDPISLRPDVDIITDTVNLDPGIHERTRIDSDSDDDLDIIKVRTKTRKKNLIDSDDDCNNKSTPQSSAHRPKGIDGEVGKLMIDESEIEMSSTNELQEAELPVPNSRWSDSESASSNPNSPIRKSKAKTKRSSKRSSQSHVSNDEIIEKPWKNLVDSDDDSDIVERRKLISATVDSDPEEDLLPIPEYDNDHDTVRDSSPIKKSTKKPKKMTHKQRDNLMKETLSKTQKMIREKPVSLPYEKPKVLSLTEFLAKRAQAKAEFYNPELRKLRPPSPSPPELSTPLDLTSLEQPLSSKKVEDWVCTVTPKAKETMNSVDDAFDKLDQDEFLLEDLTIDDNEGVRGALSGGKVSKTGSVDHEEDIPVVDLEPLGVNTKQPGSSTPQNLLSIQTSKDRDPNPQGPLSSKVDIDKQDETSGHIPSPHVPQTSGNDVMDVDIDNQRQDSSGNHEEGNKILDAEDTKSTIPEKLNPASALEEDFMAKEAALEEYLEANYPKPKRKTIAELLKSNPAYSQILNVKPKIAAGESGFIDFSSPKHRSRVNHTKLEGIDTLKSRFLKHAAPIKKPKHQHFTVTVTSKEEDSQGNENATVDKVDYVQNLSDAEDQLAIGNTSPAKQTPPGLKFCQFREKLQAKILANKVKELEEKKKNYSMYENEKTLSDKEPQDVEDILEDDDFSTESEPEESDKETEALRESLIKKKKVKSAFVDEEAEVSGSEDNSEDEQDESVMEAEDEESDDPDLEDTQEEVKKSFRRVKQVIDSSDDEDGEVGSLAEGSLPVPVKVPSSVDEDGIEVVTLDEGPEPPLVKIPSSSSELIIPKPDPDLAVGSFSDQVGSSGLDFYPMELDPESPQITPAQRERPDFAKLIDEPIISQSQHSISQLEAYPSLDSLDFGQNNSKYTFGKPLGPSLGRFDSEAALDCFRDDMPSKLPGKPLPKEIAKLVGRSDSDGEGSCPDLTTVCSGTFSSQPPLTPLESQCPGFDFQSQRSVKSVKTPVAPLAEIGATLTPRVERDTLKKTRLLFVNLDKVDAEKEDDLDPEPTVRVVKKKNRRLQFSDDEEEEAKDQDGSGSQEIGSDVEKGYDSEENEILIPKKKPISKTKGLVSKFGKIRREFVENEAELSGSEEGSGDEDERGLDQMDVEDGDDEEIDEDSVRNQLGQQHVRNLIDDDDRQIRFLQDILLEDGDLHGEGALREKQFKWKHIDKLNFDMGVADEEGGASVVEDETERLWLEQKAEKARWLKENSQILDDKIVCEDEESQKIFLERSKHFKLKKSTLKKIQSSCSFLEISSQSSAPNSGPESSVFDVSTDGIPSLPRFNSVSLQAQALFASPDDPILKIKRGSFLARGSSGLSKIAEMTKGTESNNSIKVNSRNFVFSVITPPGGGEANGGKRKRKNLPQHPSSRIEMQKRKMPRVDRSFDSLDAATKANSIFSQY